MCFFKIYVIYRISFLKDKFMKRITKVLSLAVAFCIIAVGAAVLIENMP